MDAATVVDLVVVVVVTVVVVVVVVVTVVVVVVEGHPTFGGEVIGVTPSGQHPNGEEHPAEIPVVLETKN